jgi:hypothetical protein
VLACFIELTCRVLLLYQCGCFVIVVLTQELVAVHTSGVGSTDNAVCAYVEGATSDQPDTPCKKVACIASTALRNCNCSVFYSWYLVHACVTVNFRTIRRLYL